MDSAVATESTCTLQARALSSISHGPDKTGTSVKWTCLPGSTSCDPEMPRTLPPHLEQEGQVPAEAPLDLLPQGLGVGPDPVRQRRPAIALQSGWSAGVRAHPGQHSLDPQPKRVLPANPASGQHPEPTNRMQSAQAYHSSAYGVEASTAWPAAAASSATCRTLDLYSILFYYIPSCLAASAARRGRGIARAPRSRRARPACGPRRTSARGTAGAACRRGGGALPGRGPPRRAPEPGPARTASRPDAAGVRGPGRAMAGRNGGRGAGFARARAGECFPPFSQLRPRTSRRSYSCGPVLSAVLPAAAPGL